jgi:transposase
MKEFRIPTGAELYALDLAARRERSKVLAELLKSAVRRARETVVSVFTRPYGPVRGKVVRHA